VTRPAGIGSGGRTLAHAVVFIASLTLARRRWDSVGGGETVVAAIEWALECCPDNTVWEIEHWNDLYGD